MFHHQIITEIINLVGTKEKTDLIFCYSKKCYDLHQFNVGTLYPKDVKKMNDSLKRRYKHKEIENLPTNWNEGERRLFVWFIICFLYEKKVDIKQITEKDLESLSEIFYGKDTIFLDFQLRNLPKVAKAKRSWSLEEDGLLRSAIKTLKVDLDDSKLFNNWNDVAKIMFFQTERRIFRTPKSCRERWYNHLDESKKKDEFNVEEDLILINYILNDSKSWSKIVKVMNYSRTEHRIKNRYYTLIRKYQRSLGNSEAEELTEEQEREIVLKLKVMLSAKRKRLTGPNQMQGEERKMQFEGVKMQEEVQKIGQNEEDEGQKLIQNQNSNETFKIKTQTDQSQVESVVKVKILQEQDLYQKSLSSSVDQKQSQNIVQPQVEDEKNSQSIPSYNGYWQQSCIPPYGQYMHYMNMMGQQIYDPSQVMGGAIIVNQFYCPIIFQSGMEYQFYQQ